MQGVPVIDRIPPRVRRLVVIALRLGIAAVFLFAALPKLADPAAFARDVDNYRMLPDVLVGPVAAALPVLELVVVAALLTGVHASGAALVAAGMLGAFAIGMGQALARGIDLDCGCFGAAAEAQVSGATIARNLVLMAACVPIVLAREPESQPAPVQAEG